MRRSVWSGRVGGLMCALALTLVGMSQGPAPRPSPSASRGPGGGGRPQRPGSSSGGGAGPQRPGSGSRPSSRPQRPGGDSRPQPGGPASGGRPPVGGRPPSGGRPQPDRPGGRPSGWGRPPQNRPSYQFRPNDRGALHRYYHSHLSYINRARRPIFHIGGYFPYGDIGYLSPLPPSLYGQMPPPPFGYQMGYFDGYVVVYDPVTYFIANMVDLLQ